MKSNLKTRDLVELAMFTAIIAILSMTPMGFVPIGAIKITTIHIPVIIGSIILGPKKGAFLGFMFGFFSLIVNSYLSPSITSFVFTPFGAIGSQHANYASLLICFIPRILVGIIPYWVNYLLKKLNFNKYISCVVASLAGSLTNTILVLSMIYLFFSKSYAAAINTSLDLLYDALLGIISFNGVIEAIAATIIVVPICSALAAAFKNRIAR